VDELTLIRSFGLPETGASSAERDRVRAALVAHIERTSRSRSGRRRWVVALAAALILLLAGTALALGPLRVLFEGRPAPPEVKRSIAGFNEFHDGLARLGLGGFVVRAEDATGLITFRVGASRVRVWTAPLVEGGACTFVQVPGERFLKIGPCTAPTSVQPPVLYGLSQVGGFVLLAGHVTDGVQRLALRLGSSHTRRLRLVNGFFATAFTQSQIRRDAVRPTALAGYGADSRPVANVTLPRVPPPGLTFAPPAFYKGMRALLQVNSPSGALATLTLREHNGQPCEEIWFAGGESSGCGGGGTRPGASKVSLSWLVSSSGAVQQTLLVGHVSEPVARVQIRYANGQRQTLKLLRGRFLVELTDAQLAHVAQLIARDASGRVIHEETLLPHIGP
jgi:hypothetical protein